MLTLSPLKRPVLNVLLVLAACAVYSLLFVRWALHDPASQLFADESGEVPLGYVDPELNLWENVLARPAPWRYRLVGLALTWQAWQLVSSFTTPGYVHAALCWALMCATLAGFYGLLHGVLKLQPGWAWLGLMGTATAFPVIFAYDEEIMSRIDDVLNYGLVVLGLALLMRRRWGAFVGVGVIAALTRETSLVLVLALLAVEGLSWQHKALLAVLPVMAASLPRVLLSDGGSSYLLAGLHMNMSTIPLADSSAYTLAALGCWWAGGLAAWLALRPHLKQMSGEARLLWRSAAVCVPVVIVSAALLGALRENRLLMLAFPWVIGLSCMGLSAAWPWFKQPGSLQIVLKLALGLGAAVAALGLGLAWLDAAGSVVAALRPVPGVGELLDWWLAVRSATMSDVQLAHLLANLLLMLPLAALISRAADQKPQVIPVTANLGN